MSQTNESSITWSNLGPELLDRTPRYLIYFLIFYAPFCYGLRDGVGEAFFVSVAFIAFFIHCWNCYLEDRWPRIPGWLLFCMGLIALQGLWMCLNADSYHRWHRELITLRIFLEPPPFPNLPGSRDIVSSPIQFFPQLGVFCLMLILVDSSARIRRNVLVAASVCALIFAITAITFRMAGPNWLKIYWDLGSPRDYHSVYASFRYHGNAATFLTIGLALSLGLLTASIANRNSKARAFYSSAVIIILSASIYNTSRAGWILSLIVILFFIPPAVSRINLPGSNNADRVRLFIYGATILVTLTIGIITLFYSEYTFRLDRRTDLIKSLSNRFPLFLYLQMIPDTPAWGFGPGCFSLVFPKFQVANPGMYPMKYYLNEAHQDYFQIYFDWGIFASIAWLTLLTAPLARFLILSRRSNFSVVFHGCFTAACTTLIHAAADFPLQITSLLLYLGIILASLSATHQNDP